MEVRSDENKVALPTTDNRQPTTNNEEVQSTKLEVRSVETLVLEEKVERTTQSAEQLTTDNRQPTTNNEEVQSTKLEVQSDENKVALPTTDNRQPTTKISALSLASIRAKKEMAEAQKSVVKETQHLPNEPFTETEMLEQWLKYAQRMEDKGYRIIASLLTINDPILEGATIIHELPNESSKIDFEKERPELLGYLRGKLHNHDIQIVVKVNETLVVKKAFTNQDKYNRLVEINPNLEVLKKMFDLDV
ncbi:DNA polymerase III subunit gamma/tau [Flavobacterium sp.]|uniref:DNA polymerase III subunit gamma/tau n=1 Tax=Flavobacterium sp. TaxID=239 RepID=UPI0037BE9256